MPFLIYNYKKLLLANMYYNRKLLVKYNVGSKTGAGFNVQIFGLWVKYLLNVLKMAKNAENHLFALGNNGFQSD